MSVSKYLFHRVAEVLARRQLYLTKSLTYQRRARRLPVNFDYVRYAALENCADEIAARAVPGAVAEVGVYRGDFAKRLNLLFAERPLYLFDTFAGFAAADVQTEQQRGFSTGAQDFSGTSLELVLSQMPHRALCRPRPGFFPATAAGLEDETFCFVSLDADLYEPILQGLRFFWPRLASGGYVFVHDFNNDEYKGARQAVIEFCQATGVGFVPLPDSGGTAVLTK